MFGTLETLIKANHLIKNFLGKNSDKNLIGLLTDCQNCAITIGTQIEEIYGTELNSIHELEIYCEMLYQITEVIETLYEGKRIYSESEKQLRKIKSSMESEIPDKIEIVFLPYKVSMWDSLESVWIAAEDDSDCEPYVIPIPYYDKDSVGKLTKEHY